MHVTYGFVYYFTILVSIFNVCMIVFAIRPLRRVFFNFIKKYSLLENVVLSSIIYIIYAVIIIILVDSLWTYWTLKSMIDDGKIYNHK